MKIIAICKQENHTITVKIQPSVSRTEIEETLVVFNEGGVGGGTLIFSYIHRLGSFFGFKILNLTIFGGFQKKYFFGGMKILWIFLRGHHEIGLYSGVISMYFRAFS